MARKTLKDKSAMIVAIVAIILIIIIVFTSTQREEMTLVEKWIGNILNPINEVVNTSTTTVGESLSSIFNFSKIASENEALKKEIEVLEKEVIETRLHRDELEELRGLKFALNYIEEDEKFQSIAANISAKSSSNWFDVFTIDVEKNMAFQKIALY